MACSAFSAFFFTAAEICSIEAEVSSRLAACSSVRCDRSEVAVAISPEALATSFEAALITDMVSDSRAAVVFEIGKAIQKGDAVRAIELIDQQLEADESAIGIMRASVIPTIRNLFMAKLIAEKLGAPTTAYPAFSGAINRLPESDRAWLPQKKDGSGVNVFPVFLAAQSAANFDFTGLQQVMEATLKADQALVTTGLDHRLVLHRLMAEIAAARKTGRRQAR